MSGGRALARSLGLFGVVTLVAGCGASPQRSDAPFEVVEAKIVDIQSAIREGRVSCHDVVQAYLDRIDFYDRASGLHAITVTNPRALERAEEIDRALSAGEDPGPLFCAPILVKDNFDTHDLPTTGGSIALAGSLPPDDAFMVRKLRQAGAIVVAKTNMAEWAFSPRQTVSSSYGTTANAYALDRVPAGSSGGTASGVAASFGVAGLGSDTGNSIRGPSSHLALFGIRSTLGLTSRDGVIPLSWDRDVAGPMTRTVTDGARVFNVIAGHDPADAMTELGRGRREADYTVFLRRDGLGGARLGVLRQLVVPEDSDAEIVALFERALEDLVAAGAELIDPLEFPELAEHLEADGNFCPRFRYDMFRYLETRGAESPIADVMEVLQSGQFSPYIERRLERFGRMPVDVPPEEWDSPCLTFPEHTGRRAYLEDLVRAMDEAQVDALVYPTWTHPPAALDRASEDYRGDNSQLVAPATGTPAVTVPMGFSYGRYPAGLQILGRPYSEGKLFQYAYAYEQATAHRRPPADFPALPSAGAEPLTEEP